MIAASFISIGDSSADSKGNLRASANFLERVAKRLVSAQCPGKWRRATSATRFRREADPLAEVLRDGSLQIIRAGRPRLSALRGLARSSPAESPTQSSPVARRSCARCGNPPPSRVSRLHKKCRSLVAHHRPQPTFPKFGPRSRNRPQTDRQGKRSSGWTSSCGFGISQS